MHNISLALEGAWRVLVVGLLLGAGLPAVFALGIRSLALSGRPAAGADDLIEAPTSTLGKTLATLCFGLVLLGVGLGITFIVASGFGKALSFSDIYPTLIDK